MGLHVLLKKIVSCRMNELDIYPEEKKVYFGQLLGMCDQISFPLGECSFSVLDCRITFTAFGFNEKFSSEDTGLVFCMNSHDLNSVIAQLGHKKKANLAVCPKAPSLSREHSCTACFSTCKNHLQLRSVNGPFKDFLC